MGRERESIIASSEASLSRDGVEECDRDAEEASERELERETNFERRGVGERKKGEI